MSDAGDRALAGVLVRGPDRHRRASTSTSGPTSPSTATSAVAAAPANAWSRARPTCSSPRATAASCSTTSSASSAAPATSCATTKARSPGPTPTAATAWSSRTRDSLRPMKFAVCWKWVSIGDPGGPTSSDTRWAGVSAADQAALEPRSSLVDARQGAVTVVCLGPPGADAALREALAAGAAGGSNRQPAVPASTVRPRSTVATWPPNWRRSSRIRLRPVRRLLAGPRHRFGSRLPRPRTRRGPGARTARGRPPRPRWRHERCAASAASTAAGARCSTSIRRPSSRWRVRSLGCGGPRSARCRSKAAPVAVVKAGADERATVRRRRLPVPAAGPRTAAAARRRARPGARHPRRRRRPHVPAAT